MIARQTSLSKNIVQFSRFLRQKGFVLSVEDEVTALNAMQFIDYSSSELFRLALKSVFCRHLNQLNEFDELFSEYWQEVGKAVDSKTPTKAKPAIKTGENVLFKSLKSWLNGNRNDDVEKTASYSFHENQSTKDFSSIPSDELDEMMQSIKALSKRLAAHNKRQYENSVKQNLPDLRRTLRKNMRHGGELLEIAFRKPRRNRTKLVVLCDVSKSMDLYAVFLLQFMYSFQQLYSRMETFAFGTSLQCITPIFRKAGFATALQLLNDQHNNWSGGTRIGECLNCFVKEYAPRVIDKRSVVIILSDGWDTGDIGLLAQSMKWIKERSKKVIWLNPLAGFSSYRPEVAGMRAALPYIDVFAPVHNLNSLRKLSKWI